MPLPKSGATPGRHFPHSSVDGISFLDFGLVPYGNVNPFRSQNSIPTENGRANARPLTEEET
jgi:hypothetical protein